MTSVFANSKDYFVDEAGDLTFFNSKGQIIIGPEGVSRFFLVGVACLPNPQEADQKLSALRKQLLEDPYFSGVPSMHPDAGKTALLFHASKDLPEVCREVFRMLASQIEAKVLVVVRRKRVLAEEAKKFFEKFGIKISSNDIYDDLIKRLFRNLLHKSDKNRIFISRRGRHDRLDALKKAVEKAKKNFTHKYGIKSDKDVEIKISHSHEHAGLQIIDYYLWALQRLYEREEDRFFRLLKSNYRLIIDLVIKGTNLTVNIIQTRTLWI
ncbi:MAG: DUF3800 domain-containing protein [Anaerohalosphaeraceae bacterium]